MPVLLVVAGAPPRPPAGGAIPGAPPQLQPPGAAASGAATSGKCACGSQMSVCGPAARRDVRVGVGW